ncbi:MAG: cobyrinate a,c-diamide synthase [Acidimicrobiales bacterium]
MLGPRLLVAGTASGVGKTTVATGLMAAFRKAGVRVAAAKVGPDFIDPGYHALATGRPPRNLDPWMCGADIIPALAARAAAGADLLVVEGVMGLFDGAGATEESSTAHVARLIEAPVILVVDASAMGVSVAALVAGYRDHDPGLAIGAVILNRVGSDRHEAILRQALLPLGIPVAGALRRDDRLTWRDRHLGLIPVVEHPAEVRSSLDRLAAVIAAHLDLGLLRRLAAAAPTRPTPPPPTAAPARTGTPCSVPAAARTAAAATPSAAAPHLRRRAGTGSRRIAVAAGPAFSFGYPDNGELLEQAGAELVPFDPLRDPGLPDGVSGLVAGGGFPEVYAEALAANGPLLADVRAGIAGGLVTWAECGGALWLAECLDARELCRAIPAQGRMTQRLTLGYRRARFRIDNPLGPAGTEVRGHEFHYSLLDPPGDALDLRPAGDEATTCGGWASPTLLASYLHLHLAGAPELATEFVGRVTASQTG